MCRFLAQGKVRSLVATCAFSAWAILLTLSLVGCGKGDPYGIGKTVKVQGTISLGKEPLRIPPGGFGKVWLYPDTSKGNNSPQIPIGAIGPKGGYKVFTRDQEGAPPGWYKVMIVATEPGLKKSRDRKPLLHAKYSSPETSGLFIHVVETPAPGAYNLKVTK